MEYTKIDPDEVAQEVISNKHRQIKQNIANLVLDSERIDFCQAVRVADGKDLDEDMATMKETLADSKEGFDAEKVRLENKLNSIPNDDTDRIEWLEGFIEQVEREYATHSALVADAKENGDTEQEEASTVAMIVCDGAHDAAKKELAALKAKKAPGKPIA